MKQTSSGIDAFWSKSAQELLKELKSEPDGLTTKQARQRHYTATAPLWTKIPGLHDFILLSSQLKSPLFLLLFIAATLSFCLGDYKPGIVIIALLTLCVLAGFAQERAANNVIKELTKLVQTHVRVMRDKKPVDLTPAQIVPGDIVLLKAGDLISGDAYLLEAQDLTVNEAALTGEPFPRAKKVSLLDRATPLGQRCNSVFAGTNVVCGSARALVVNVGNNTLLGKIGTHARSRSCDTFFERGIRSFGYFLLRMSIVATLLIILINLYAQKPFFDSLLFALSLAIGLVPELLPAILTVILASGAKKMAASKVIVKRLASIENLGALTVLCSDKTGTLTTGNVTLEGLTDFHGVESKKTKLYATLNSYFETGFANPLDLILKDSIDKQDLKQYTKVGELTHDFMRKRLSVIVRSNNQTLMLTKGSFKSILSICDHLESAEGDLIPHDQGAQVAQEQADAYGRQGLRTLGICYKIITTDPALLTQHDEQNMIFVGFAVFNDPLKEGIKESMELLKTNGISLKVITGDSEVVAAATAQKLGLDSSHVVSAQEIDDLPLEELAALVNRTTIFCEVDPFQKEHIVQALARNGHVVGYLGDGINDAPALKAADVSIAPENGVDIAKEVADIVLLEKDLNVIAQGIQQGRSTLYKMFRYLMITTSSNIGNMISMTAASAILPFLPLAPVHILFLNLLNDFPLLAITSDHVDPEALEKPLTWNNGFLVQSMVRLGIVSSIFDFITFGMLFYFHTTIPQFRTGWLTVSIITQVLAIYSLRTQRAWYASKPSRLLIITGVAVILVALILPYTPLASPLEVTPLSGTIIIGTLIIAGMYISTIELLKKYILDPANSLIDTQNSTIEHLKV